MSEQKQVAWLGVFSTGDLIALGTVVFMSGALWVQVSMQKEELHRQGGRLRMLEQVVPSEYVRRQDYREDVREIKDLLRAIDAKVDGKVDRNR